MTSLFSKAKTPAAPDYRALIELQGIQNKDAARTTQQMGMVDTATPFGGTSFQSIGGDRYQQNATLDPVIQAFVDQGLATGGNAVSTEGLAAWRTPSISQHSLQRVEDALYDRQMAQLNPELAQDRSRLESTLAARGITAGSDAYRQAMDDQARRESEARATARTDAITGSGQEQSRQYALSSAFADASNSARSGELQERILLSQLPTQYLSGIVGLGRQALGQGIAPAQTGVASTDVTGAAGLSQSSALARYQAQVGQQNSLLGGLFGLGSAALGGWLGA